MIVWLCLIDVLISEIGLPRLLIFVNNGLIMFLTAMYVWMYVCMWATYLYMNIFIHQEELVATKKKKKKLN